MALRVWTRLGTLKFELLAKAKASYTLMCSVQGYETAICEGNHAWHHTF